MLGPITCNNCDPKCLIQIVVHVEGLLIKIIQTLGHQHLRNFDVAHDLTKASTTNNHPHQPQRISGNRSSCNPKQEVALLSSQPPLPIIRK